MQKKILLNLLVISLCGILLSTIALFALQTRVSYNTADEVTSTRLDDVEDLIRQNENQIEELTREHNEELLSHARSLAVMIEFNPDIVKDNNGLKQIIDILNIDEMHIIDEDGILRWGTEPKYYGMDFATTEQTKPFLAILDDPSFEFVQEPMPNGSIGLMRQYAGVSLRNQKGIVQVGIDPIRLEQALKNNQINHVLKGITVGNTGYMFSISNDTGAISSHPNTRLVGRVVMETLQDNGIMAIDGQRVRYGTKNVGDDTLVAVIPLAELNEKRILYSTMFLGLMFLLFTALFLRLNLYMKKNVIDGISETLKTLKEISKGNLDVTAEVRTNVEFEQLSDGINQMVEGVKARNLYEEHARRFGAVISMAGSGVVIKDKDGVITDWNVGASNVLGYSPEEVIGKKSDVYMGGAQLKKINKTNEKLIRGESVPHMDVEVIHKENGNIICSASYSPIFDSNHRTTGSVVVFHDVTEDKIAEEKAKDLAAIIAIADAGIILKDKDGFVREWNVGAENIFGFQADEMIGKTTRDYAPEESYADIDEIKKKLENGEHITHKEVVRKHKSGRLINCSASYTPIFGDDGEMIGSVSIFHDISDKKKMEHALREAWMAAEEASSVKSDFLANISHEIRTPMNAVIGMAELLLAEDLTARQRRYTKDIKASGDNLLGIINNILDLSKIESGNFEIKPVDYDFMALLENINSIFKFTAQSKRIAYRTETVGELPPCLYGDDTRLRQVLTNLLGNAVKFTAKGHVKLKTWVSKNEIFFDVSDTGSGIKENDLGKLFDAFHQVDMSVNKAKEGTGLGLSITKSLVEAMGGSITVESEYGKGSVFHVRIPLIEGNPDNVQKRPAPYRFISAPDASILVVDDFEINRNVVTGLLQLSDVHCDTATSGEQAIRMIQNKKYDIVFMDHMMPGMDGVETTQAIRKLGYPKKEYPIIALTANAVEGVREKLIDSGMNDFLSKPIDKVLLNEMLIKWLPPKKIELKHNDSVLNRKVGKPEDHEMEKLRQIEILDVDSGLVRMAGSEKMYKDTLQIIIKKIPELVGTMKKNLENGKLELFSIDIHGLKNSLATIGANELSDSALCMERKSKDGDAIFCNERFQRFTGRLMELYKECKPIFDKGEKASLQTGDKGDLKILLDEVKYQLDGFNEEKALQLIEEVRGLDYGRTINDLLKTLYGQVEMFEYENAYGSLEQLNQATSCLEYPLRIRR